MGLREYECPKCGEKNMEIISDGKTESCKCMTCGHRWQEDPFKYRSPKPEFGKIKMTEDQFVNLIENSIPVRMLKSISVEENKAFVLSSLEIAKRGGYIIKNPAEEYRDYYNSLSITIPRTDLAMGAIDYLEKKIKELQNKNARS